MHTLTAKNQANPKQKAIIWERSRRPKLRQVFPHQKRAHWIERPSAFEFGADEISPVIPPDLKDVGLTADLAVFDIGLSRAARFIDHSLIPLSTTCTLKACQ
jgi:hypothetical protein